MNLFQDPTWCSASDLRTAFGHGLAIPLLIAAAEWGLRRHLLCPRAVTPSRAVPLIVVPGAPQHTRPGNAVALDDGMVATVHLCVWPIYLTLLVVALQRWSFRRR